MASDPHLLARIHNRMQRGDLAGALTAIEQLAAANPDDGPTWHLAGIIRRRAGQSVAAVTALKQAIANGFVTAEVWNALGLAQEETGALTEAVKAFDAAAAADPDYIPALTNGSRVLSMLDEHERAIDLVGQAIQRHPGSVQLNNALAAAHSAAGNQALAVDLYRQALAMDPANKIAAIRLGQVLREQGHANQAVAHFSSIHSRLSGSPEVSDAMAGALIEAGRPHEGEALLEQVCVSSPNYFAAHRAIARLAREYDTGKDPYRTYRELARRWPTEPTIWHEWLAVMMQYRDYTDALPVIDQALHHTGDSAHLRLVQAMALSELGQREAAEQLFRQLGDENTPAGQALLIARARNALSLGDAELARKLSQKATTRRPEDQFGWAYLGLAWRMLGDEREFWLFDYDKQVQQIALPTLCDPATLAALNDRLRLLHTATSHPPDQSLRGGTQTEGDLFRRAETEIRSLRDDIRGVAQAHAAAMPDDPDHPLYRRKQARIRFAGSWSVRLTTAGFHIAHVHQNGWLSSALHLVVPPLQAGESGDAGALVLGAPPVELGLCFAPRKIVRPRAGHLVLFPSAMWHATLPFFGGSERLTVAFDALPA